MTTLEQNQPEEVLNNLAQANSVLEVFLIVYVYLWEKSLWQAAFPRRHEFNGIAAHKLTADWRTSIISAAASRPPEYIVDYFHSTIANARLVSSADSATKLLVGLRAIDRAFVGADLFGADATNELEPFRILRARLRDGKPYETWNGFGIYPKPRAQLDLRGQYLGDFFDYLSVVELSKRGGILVRYKPSFSGASLKAEQLSRVGIIPVVLNPGEVAWTTVEHERYRVALQADQLSAIVSRVIEGLDWLMAREPQVVLLPELVSHQELFVSIRAYLAGRAEREEFIPGLVLCGSLLADVGNGLDEVKNQATVLAGTGRVLWRQDKMHAYHFSAAEQAATGLPFKELTCTSRTEDIAIEPREIVVYDLAPALRCAVFICEDFQQASSAAALEDWDMSLFLVPVMNAPIDSNGWIDRRSLNLAARPAAMSAVANSATLVAPKPPGATAKEMAGQLACVIGYPRVDVEWEVMPVSGATHPAALFASLTKHATA